MNVPQIASAPAATTSEPKRTPGARASEAFSVPDAAREERPHASEGRERDDDPQRDAGRAKRPDVPCPEDIAAWMLTTIALVVPPAPAPHVDVTAPEARITPHLAPPPALDPTVDGAPQRDFFAPNEARDASEGRDDNARSIDDLTAAAPTRDERAASEASASSASRRGDARESPLPAPRASPSPIGASKLSASLTAKALEAVTNHQLDRAASPSSARDEAASSELASASLSSAGSPWVTSIATPATRITDSGLTAVNGPTQTASAERDPLRERLQGAQTSAINQRTLQNAAHGEVVLPELGRVAVDARSEREAVTIEVRAAQSSTAQMLHAHASLIAADVKAADIPVSSVSFEGAGTWNSTSAAPRARAVA